MREKDLLSKKEIGSIFSNLESLVPVNEAILAELNERSADKNVISEVGDIFLSHIGMFKLYAVYCSNQHQVPKRLKEYYERDPELKKTLEVLLFPLRRSPVPYASTVDHHPDCFRLQLLLWMLPASRCNHLIGHSVLNEVEILEANIPTRLCPSSPSAED